MPKHQLFHEKVDGQIIPYWYVISYKDNELNWDKYVLYIDYQLPYQYQNRNNFNDSIPSISLDISDFIFLQSDLTRFCINLKKLKKRIHQYNLSPSMFKQFIIPVPYLNPLLDFIQTQVTKVKR